MRTTTAEPVRKTMGADDPLDRMLGYNVEDPQGDRIGHVSGVWLDEQNQVAFVGAKTTWLMGKTHIFPAEGMEVNHGREIIRAPYATETVKNAPTFDPGAELDAGEQQEIWSYYQQHGLRRGAPERQTTGTLTREEVRIPLAEEQLKVGKRQVESGGVRLRKVVRTEPAQQDVELRREEIQIERVPAGEGTKGRTTEKSFESEDIFIPLRHEEAVVQKEARVREEVRVSKKAQTERQTVSEKLRKEELDTAGRRSEQEEEESARLRQDDIERERGA